MSNNQEKEPLIRGSEYIKSDKISFEQINNEEYNVELSPRDIEARTEKARTEAMTTLSMETKKNKAKHEKDSNIYHRGSINKKQRDDSYKKTLAQIQNELPMNESLFSKFTHNKIIEKTSDILGNTIARPDTVLSGAIFAFILTLITYITAKTIGYVLSGFETIASFLIGWTLGIIYDYLRVLITGKKF